MGRSRTAKTPVATVDKAPKVLDRITPQTELELFRRLWAFAAQMREARDADRVLRRALQLALDVFRVADGCLAVVRPGHSSAAIVHSSRPTASWDAALLTGFLRGDKVSVPPDLMLARIRRCQRMWGVLAVRCAHADFQWDARQAFSSIGALATQLVERIDEDRVRKVRAQIDQKILEQIAPNDLSYQLLHGIRSLIGYDHSAALLLVNDGCSELEIVGEQIAWHKAKSQQVGRKLPLSKAALEMLSSQRVCGFDREGRGWTEWTETSAESIAELLDYNRDGLAGRLTTAEGAMLCAPVGQRRRLIGILKVASIHGGSFGPHEVEVIAQFLPHLALVLQNVRRTESLEQRMRKAERKQAMADLARGVAHDVNNAFGAILPLVQQLREEFAEGGCEPEVVRDDLRQIESSLQVCRRIFGGMLAFARSASRNASDVHLGLATENALSILREGLERGGVAVHVCLADDLPPLTGMQTDIEQLLLNLIGNARDAMPEGGKLVIQAKSENGRVELVVEDSGCGIPQESLALIQEPFYTTKESGNGLGLSICRSIVSEMRGKLQIDSLVGRGTRVTASFPLRKESGE